MSAKILRKNDAEYSGVEALALKEIGTAETESRGLKKMQFPDLSELGGVLPVQSGSGDPLSPNNLLDEARNQAAQILRDAEARKEEVARESQAQAMKEFEDRVAAEVESRTDALRDEMADTIERIAGLEKEISRKVELDLVGLALAVSKKIIGREIETDHEIVVDLLNKALIKLQDRSHAEVLLNPDDLAYIEEHREKVLFSGSLDLKADPSVSSGGCLIRTKSGDIDARIESQFEQLSHALIDY